MKITTELEIDISAKAIYRAGKVTVSLIGSIPYGNGRQASVTIEDTTDKIRKAFENAFNLLLESNKEQIAKQAQAAHAEALTVAARMGEI